MRRASVRNLTCSAVFVAMQIVLARFCGVQINEGLRLSFEGVPILLAGIWLGPLWGMAVGCVADVLGTIISGYGVYFPLLTVGPVLLGGLGGLGARFFLTREGGWRGALGFLAAVAFAEAVNSLLYSTWALTLYYSVIMGQEMPFSVLFAMRAATKPSPPFFPLPHKTTTLRLSVLSKRVRMVFAQAEPAFSISRKYEIPWASAAASKALISCVDKIGIIFYRSPFRTRSPPRRRSLLCV